MDKKALEYEITVLEETLKQKQPNLAAIKDYIAKVMLASSVVSHYSATAHYSETAHVTAHVTTYPDPTPNPDCIQSICRTYS